MTGLLHSTTRQRKVIKTAFGKVIIREKDCHNRPHLFVSKYWSNRLLPLSFFSALSLLSLISESPSSLQEKKIELHVMMAHSGSSLLQAKKKKQWRVMIICAGWSFLQKANTHWKNMKDTTFLDSSCHNTFAAYFQQHKKRNFLLRTSMKV